MGIGRAGMSEGDADPLWDDESFRSRVTDLATLRGRSVSEVCYAAGLSYTYLAKPAGKSGRSIEALLKIARELEVSVIELVGTINHHDSAPSDDNLARLSLTFELASYVYVALGARRQVPAAKDTMKLVAEIMRMIESSGKAEDR